MLKKSSGFGKNALKDDIFESSIQKLLHIKKG
jgi:hypothetical protein